MSSEPSRPSQPPEPSEPAGPQPAEPRPAPADVEPHEPLRDQIEAVAGGELDIVTIDWGQLAARDPYTAQDLDKLEELARRQTHNGQSTASDKSDKTGGKQ